MCKSFWAPKQRLVLSDTLRAGGPRTKWKSSLAVSDTVDQQARWFCARSFKTTMGSRLKDSEARRTLASDALPGSWPLTSLAMRIRETHYDVQISLDAQKTIRFQRHPPSQRAQDKMVFQFGISDTQTHRGAGFALGPSKLP